eukprot:Em0007g834a
MSDRLYVYKDITNDDETGTSRSISMTLKSKTLDVSSSVGVTAKKVLETAGLGGGILTAVAEMLGVGVGLSVSYSGGVALTLEAATLGMGATVATIPAIAALPVVIVGFPLMLMFNRRKSDSD